MNVKLTHLAGDIRRAKARHERAIALAFPVGMEVHVVSGHKKFSPKTYRETPAVVVETVWGSVVVDSSTGRRYSVDASRLLEYDSMEVNFLAIAKE